MQQCTQAFLRCVGACAVYIPALWGQTISAIMSVCPTRIESRRLDSIIQVHCSCVINACLRSTGMPAGPLAILFFFAVQYRAILSCILARGKAQSLWDDIVSPELHWMETGIDCGVKIDYHWCFHLPGTFEHAWMCASDCYSAFTNTLDSTLVPFLKDVFSDRHRLMHSGAFILPSKMHIPHHPWRLIPALAYTFTGCLALHQYKD